jgi:TRAP-type C4-dicarboxylate transport system permease small subunit
MRKTIDKAMSAALVFLMVVIVLDVVWQVFSRYVLSSPSSYTDELAGYLLIWIGLLGAAYVCGQKEHLAIDILLQRSGEKTRFRLEMFIYILTVVFALCVMTIGGIWLVYTRFILEVTSASLEINLGYVYLILPLSGLLIIYYSIDNAARTAKDYKQSGQL